jgi:hypothetical protein
VIFIAWQNGARFDAWKDQHNPAAWQTAFERTGLDPAFYTHRERPLGETFPWDHISTTVRAKFLQQEYLRSQRSETLDDCRNGCFACGILPTFADVRRQNPGEIWKCPEVPQRRPIPVEALPLLD